MGEIKVFQIGAEVPAWSFRLVDAVVVDREVDQRLEAEEPAAPDGGQLVPVQFQLLDGVEAVEGSVHEVGQLVAAQAQLFQGVQPTVDQAVHCGQLITAQLPVDAWKWKKNYWWLAQETHGSYDDGDFIVPL